MQIKGNYKFNFPLKENGQRVIPFSHCIDYLGQYNGFLYAVENAVGVKVVGDLQGQADGSILVRFEQDLTAAQTTALTNIVDFYKAKDSYTAIELIQIEWADPNNLFPIRDTLPNIENDLKAIYTAQGFVWDNLSHVEKRILAFWHVCTPAEAITVFTQAELDSFRFYEMYKYLEPPIQEKLSKADIYKTPRNHDFKLEFSTLYHKDSQAKEEGRPTKKEYYKDFNDSTLVYSGKFAELNFEISDDASNLISSKLGKMYWAFNTGELDMANFKVIPAKSKIYHPTKDMAEKLQEAEQKRSSIYTDMQNTVVAFVMQTRGLTLAAASAIVVAFAKEIQTEIHDWIEFGAFKLQQLKDAIANADVNTHVWLDDTVPGQAPLVIRGYMDNEVSIS